ncbi:YuzD family protein [Virgibacillus soli]|uniref:YuzD family protein n=1 Tax=Paracerasibacillus soli TaxID=480284 RepID=A0ABU5CQZ4_9BACI|nr:YuzD family protein [Virgibacillus soli]MDY0408782.1 YuzD family protein [Virgibacillus soli]
MKNNHVLITIYGAEQICASCVGAPGSKDTYEWLQAAIGRKYDTNHISYQYIDIDKPMQEEKHIEIVEKILQDEYFYPLVTVNGEIVAEGIPKLKTVYEALNKHHIAPL